MGAQKELSNAIGCLDQDVIQRELRSKGIEWLFNCMSNPEAGGCWERMVRSIKRVLSVTLKETAPQIETLRCLLNEAANIVNSRPLTHVPVDTVESEPLTPNHFLLGEGNATFNLPDTELQPHTLRRQWKIAQQLVQRFLKRWVQEYLPELTRRTKWHKDVKPIEVNDLVLIIGDNTARGQWPRGIVSQVFVGPDNRVRSALIRTASGSFRRPLTKLARLD